MEKCKFCQAELEEGSTVCPGCGKDNAQAEPETEETAVVEVEEAAQQEQTAEETAPAEEAAEEQTVPVEEKKEEPKKKATPGKIAAAVVAVVVLAAVLIALLAGGLGSGSDAAAEPTETAAETQVTEETAPATTPADTGLNDATCKGTYTASDEEVIANADTVVATMGEYELTNSQLQVYYWMEVQTFLSNYGSYVYYYGLDYTQPLDTQVCGIAETGTWQQLFLSNCLQSWQNYQAFAAKSEGLDAEYQEILDTMTEALEENAAANGFADVQEMINYNFGPGATAEDYAHFMDLYYRGYSHFDKLYAEINPTDEEIDAYFTEHEADYNTNGITRDGKFIDVRHILIVPEGGTTDESGTTTYSDEEWAACEAAAQAVLDEWLAGEKTEESFAELANTYTDDGNDANYDGVPDGGLYTQVTEGQMVTEFNDWCFDEARVHGDYGLVKTVYGYHVMFFVDGYPMWDYYAESDLITELSNQMVADVVAEYPMEVDYEKILLGYVDMGA